MDKFQKALKKLNKKELRQLEDLLTQLKAGSFQNPNVKKLKGSSGIYRVRKGNLRVIYEFIGGKVFILQIGLRDKRTYKKF